MNINGVLKSPKRFRKVGRNRTESRTGHRFSRLQKPVRMPLCYMTPLEIKRKEEERISMLEGIHLWKRQKEDNRLKTMREKREMRDLLESYWPWGKPGGGAPNSQALGRGNLHLEELYAIEDMKKAKRQVGAFQFGKPGGGAPHVSKTGHKQVGFREDPNLRFQWGEDLRRTVDNTLRYRSKREDQEEYKQQLDAMVEEKRRAREYELKKKLDFERKMILRTPPWGKPGPGGTVWRKPKNLGVNFLKSMGWTNDAAIRRLHDERAHHHQHHRQHHPQNHFHHSKWIGDAESASDAPKRETVCSLVNNFQNQPKRNSVYKLVPPPRNSSGIELVPLLVRRRLPPVKVALGTTDVTRGDANPKRMNISEPKYLKDLTDQVHHKHQKIKDLRNEDIQNCKKHFETWGGFWGRPGHGAPKSGTQKRRLTTLLYPQRQPMPVH